MLDLKKYSIKECIDQACFGEKGTPLVIGLTHNKKELKDFTYYQYYDYGDKSFYAFSTSWKERTTNINHDFEFSITSDDRCIYHLHFISDRFNEKLELTNVGFHYKIKKDKTRVLNRKRYTFKNKTIRMDYERREFTTYYESHRHKIKVNRNGTTNHYIRFKDTGLELHENYNSKGMCTKSMIHLANGRSLQLHYKNKKVIFFCKDDNGSLRQSKFIPLPNLKDASVLNLYAHENCFTIDLVLPSNELFYVYNKCLQELYENALAALSADPAKNPALFDVIRNIELYMEKNEEKDKV